MQTEAMYKHGYIHNCIGAPYDIRFALNCVCFETGGKGGGAGS